jgi:hypothetical protein
MVAGAKIRSEGDDGVGQTSLRFGRCAR